MTALWCSLATAKRAIFLQNILWESCSKFYFKQCSLKKFLKKLILWREYMEMCFHSNQHPWAIKHRFISLYFKYQSLRLICLPVMNSPVFPSLDDIYCRFVILLNTGVLYFFYDRRLISNRKTSMKRLRLPPLWSKWTCVATAKTGFRGGLMSPHWSRYSATLKIPSPASMTRSRSRPSTTQMLARFHDS